MISLIYPAYNPTDSRLNITYPMQELMDIHINNWRSYSPEQREQLEVIIVDDCSPMPIWLCPDFPMNIKAYYIVTDIYWNISGALNLGHSQATHKWHVNLDFDHILTPNEFDKINNFDKKDNTIYYLKRSKSQTPTIPYKPSPNAFVISSENYKRIGGYDENLAGNGGHNDTLIKMLMNKEKYTIDNIDANLILYDKFLTTGNRGKKGKDINKRKVEEIRQQLSIGTYNNKQKYNYNWKQQYEHRINTQ